MIDNKAQRSQNYLRTASTTQSRSQGMVDSLESKKSEKGGIKNGQQKER